MTPIERRVRLEAALELIHTVYRDMCRDINVSKETIENFCELQTKMIYFASSLDPRPSDKE